MSVRISTCWISVNILLGFVLSVSGEHFYLPKENNVFANDFQDDWVPMSGVDKRSTRLNHAGITQVVHITPPVRYPSRPNQQQDLDAAGSNKVEVFAQAPPTILGSFSEFGHATIEAREPAHTLNFRPSFNFDRHYEESDNDRRYQQNDYRSEETPPPAIVVFNAQQRHPQPVHKSQGPPPPPPPPQFYQNFQYHQINTNLPNLGGNKNFGFKEPPSGPLIQEQPPKRLTPYYVSNDHIFPRPQGNTKQVYAEQRPKPYLVSPVAESVVQPQLQQQHHHNHHHQQQQQKKQTQQPFKASTEVQTSAGYFHKYPGHVVQDTPQTLYAPPPPLAPQVSNFARPFEQTNDHSVYIKPNQYVHDLHVGTQVQFGPSPQDGSVGQSSARPADVTTGFTHPATRPFSKYQTPSPKNEELYRIYPVKEVNALPAFLPTPVTHGLSSSRPAAAAAGHRPYFKEPSGGSSEYDVRYEQDENESGEQYDVLRNPPTRPMATTSTTTSTTAPPPARHSTSHRKRKPSTTSSTSTTTTTTTTTTTMPPPPSPAQEDYDEYAVPNVQQLQLQEQRQEYVVRPEDDRYQPQRHQHQQQQLQQYNQYKDDYDPMTVFVTTTEQQPTTHAIAEERPVPAVSVNKYKKKKPVPASRPKDAGTEDDAPERMTLQTAAAVTTVAPAVQQHQHTATTAEPVAQSNDAAADARAKTKAKYGTGTRPRFSIKDYKTTTSTTTTSTSTERTGRRTTTTVDPETGEQQTTTRKPYKPRPRPNRYKSSAGTSTTATAVQEPEQSQQETTTTTERTTYRSKYKPGKYYNRLRTTSTESAVLADDGGEPAATTEPTTRPAVYSAKRRTVPSLKSAAVEEHNALRRSSSAPPDPQPLHADAVPSAVVEDADYVATTVAVTTTPSPSPRHKFQHHAPYPATDRPLLPIESFFQSSAVVKRHYYHDDRR